MFRATLGLVRIGRFKALLVEDAAGAVEDAVAGLFIVILAVFVTFFRFLFAIDDTTWNVSSSRIGITRSTLAGGRWNITGYRIRLMRMRITRSIGEEDINIGT